MSKKKNILYLAHRIPYPPNKGDKIRSFNEVRHLAENFEVDLVCLADNPSEVRHKQDLEKICNKVFVFPLHPLAARLAGLASMAGGGTVSVGYFYRRQVQLVIDQWLLEKDYDAVVCFSSTTAEYIFRSRSLPREGRRPRLVMDFCDVDSDKWLQYSQQSRFPLSALYRIEQSRLLDFEKKVNDSFNSSIFISEKEANLFRTYYPEAKNIVVVPNGVDSTYFSPDAALELVSAKEKSPMLLFTGAMDYHANVDGVSWFCDEILPKVRRDFPETQFYIVGSNPSSSVKKLAVEDGVTVTGFVEDIRPYYSAADISVIPLRLARGVQNKVLEAMSMGKAVVTTSKALEGIAAIADENVLVADHVEDFARAVTYLIENPDVRKCLGEKARQFVARTFDWSANMTRLAEQLSM